MHADCYFTIGRTHKVCQDYAAAGNDKDWPHSAYAIVSDGCSSSPDTDIGARRMVVWGTDNLLHSFGNRIHWDAVAENALPDCDLLSPFCIDATLLALRQCESFENEAPVLGDQTILALLAGDGVVAARRRDGKLNYWVVSYEPGEGGVAPAYPNYLNDPDRLEQYLALGHGITTISEYLDGELVVASQKVVDPKDFGWEIRLDSEEFDFVAVFSDGVESFYTKNSSGQITKIPLLEVLQQVMAIKNPKGQFVTRRCKRFFESHCVLNGWEHADDFSMAAIWCRED